jgi:UrcA family protein
MKTPTIVLAAAAAFIATASGAATIRVDTRDLNLASAEGQKRLDNRIAHAARTVCGVGDQITGTRIRDQQIDECYRTALVHARAQTAMLTPAGADSPTG